MTIDVRPLTEESWPELAELFGQGGDPKWCWCMFWRVPGSNWSNTSADENRAALRSRAEREPAPGLVAMRDGEAVGWVGLSPREDYERLGRSRTIPQLPGERVWSIVCFVVGRRARRSGVASALVEAAVDYARQHGAAVVEAYPVKTDGQRITSASAYTGTLSMFLRAGFEVASKTTSTAGGGMPRVVVRHVLAAGHPSGVRGGSGPDTRGTSRDTRRR